MGKSSHRSRAETSRIPVIFEEVTERPDDDGDATS
jgi:hypothetical protein